jgi:DNA-binding NarL/FixJ family response regulator
VATDERAEEGTSPATLRHAYRTALERAYQAGLAELRLPDSAFADGGSAFGVRWDEVRTVRARLEAAVRRRDRPSAADTGEEVDGGPLTRRQVEILLLLSGGVTTDEIARRLCLSRTTVRNHVARALGRLGAHSRLEAVALARRDGLLPVEGAPGGHDRREDAGPRLSATG